MTTMWIRVKRDGYLFPFDEILAQNPECEVITEQEAFPEKFITPEVKQAIEKVTKTRTRRAPLALNTEVPTPPPYNSPELAADASQGILP